MMLCLRATLSSRAAICPACHAAAFGTVDGTAETMPDRDCAWRLKHGARGADVGTAALLPIVEVLEKDRWFRCWPGLSCMYIRALLLSVSMP